MKGEDKPKNNKGNLKCFMNKLIKAAKLTRREDKGGFWQAVFLCGTAKSHCTPHLDQPAHWTTRRNKGRGFTRERGRKQLRRKKMKKDEVESGEV